MAGIAGIAKPGKSVLVKSMLEKITHRGPAGRYVLEDKLVTLGVVWPDSQAEAGPFLEHSRISIDEVDNSHFALVAAQGFMLKRDPVGAAPLYYGFTTDGSLCFASEVKALLEATSDVNELPPGHIFDKAQLYHYEPITAQPASQDSPEKIARELCLLLENAVQKRIRGSAAGVWLSGGLDSSLLAALARPHVHRLHSFSGGLPGAPDLKHARMVARQLQSEHHEVRVHMSDCLKILTDVIYHLESFDALLVRSSLINYLVAKLASEYVPAVFSGEGADELFAGYEYLKSLPPGSLAGELVEITNQLHNTALQRVDRCASAHGLIVHISFLESDVLNYALRIPQELKIKDGVEKWILRQAAAGKLPDGILNRPKAKFWDGAGVGELLAEHADRHISTTDFEREKHLPNGWTLDSKEELMYYRIFREHFGRCKNLSWMGRTKIFHAEASPPAQ
jgi:asparagine synthase (glutamine-hydrolysing)